MKAISAIFWTLLGLVGFGFFIGSIITELAHQDGSTAGQIGWALLGIMLIKRVSDLEQKTKHLDSTDRRVNGLIRSLHQLYRKTGNTPEPIEDEPYTSPTNPKHKED